MSGVATATAIVATGVLGTGASMSAAGKSSRAAKDAASKQEAMSNKELAFRQAMYDYEKQMTQPIRQKLTDEAMSGEPLDYAQTSAKIKQNYADARRRLAEQGYGTGTVGSPLGAAGAQGMELAEASDLGGAFAQGMSAKRGLGTTLMGYGNVNGTGNGVAGAMGSQGGLYGQQAAQYGTAAQQAWANAGNALNGTIRDLGRINYGGSESPATSVQTNYTPDPTMALPASNYGGPSPILSQTPSYGSEVLSYQPATSYNPVTNVES